MIEESNEQIELGRYFSFSNNVIGLFLFGYAMAIIDSENGPAKALLALVFFTLVFAAYGLSPRARKLLKQMPSGFSIIRAAPLFFAVLLLGCIATGFVDGNILSALNIFIG